MIVWSRVKVTSPLPAAAAAISKSVSHISSAPSSGSPSARKNSAKRQCFISNSSASLSWRSISTVTSCSVISAIAVCIAAHLRRGLPSTPLPMAANSCFDQSRKACLTILSAFAFLILIGALVAPAPRPGLECGFCPGATAWDQLNNRRVRSYLLPPTRLKTLRCRWCHGNVTNEHLVVSDQATTVTSRYVSSWHKADIRGLDRWCLSEARSAGNAAVKVCGLSGGGRNAKERHYEPSEPAYPLCFEDQPVPERSRPSFNSCGDGFYVLRLQHPEVEPVHH